MRSLSRFAMSGVVLVALLSSGCADANWPLFSQAMQSLSKEAGKVILAHDQIAPKKKEICEAIGAVAEVLENYDNPDATFAELRKLTLDAIEMLKIDENLKPYVTSVVDYVMTQLVGVAQSYYADFVQTSEARAVLEISRAVARGLREACNELPTAAPKRLPNSFLFPPGS